MSSVCPEALRETALVFHAARALAEELETYPKPGLVSWIDRGSHPEMDANCFVASIRAIAPFFGKMAAVARQGGRLLDLRRIGIVAEESMLRATQGRNTHRGAIFCLGLLAAASARRQAKRPGCSTRSLGEIVATEWGNEILLAADLLATSPGLQVCHRHGIGGARLEARRGFPCIFRVGLPIFRFTLARTDRNAARVQALFFDHGGLRGHDPVQARRQGRLDACATSSPPFSPARRRASARLAGRSVGDSPHVCRASADGRWRSRSSRRDALRSQPGRGRMTSLVLLCPGQGTQSPDLFSRFSIHQKGIRSAGADSGQRQPAGLGRRVAGGAGCRAGAHLPR